MVTAAEETERPAMRPATRSPFGLMADIGAALAAELGMPLVHIARHLGPSVSDQTARGAVARGRRELVARRVNPAAFRARQLPADPMLGTPIQPADVVLPVPADEPPTLPGSRGSADELLRWAESGPQRAGTLAAKVRVLLGEIEQTQKASRKNQAKMRARSEQRREAVPADLTPAERRAYYRRVRAWAREHGFPAPPDRIVPIRTIRAYEAAHASASQQPTDEGDPHRPG